MANSPLVFFVPGKPIPWHRPRKNGSQFYTHAGQRTYQTEVALMAKSAMATQELMLMVGPLVVSVRATIAIPSSFGKAAKEKAASGGMPASTGLDLDNLCKAIFDALNGIVYGDDRQIAQIEAAKYYGPNPHVRVTVQEVEVT